MCFTPNRNTMHISLSPDDLVIDETTLGKNNEILVPGIITYLEDNQDIFNAAMRAIIPDENAFSSTDQVEPILKEGPRLVLLPKGQKWIKDDKLKLTFDYGGDGILRLRKDKSVSNVVGSEGMSVFESIYMNIDFENKEKYFNADRKFLNYRGNLERNEEIDLNDNEYSKFEKQVTKVFKINLQVVINLFPVGLKLTYFTPIP